MGSDVERGGGLLCEKREVVGVVKVELKEEKKEKKEKEIRELGL